jgi:hypothetical protein
MNQLKLLTFCLLSSITILSNAQSLNFKQDTEVKAEPNTNAASVVQAKSQSTAEILERNGFWVKVKIGNTQGWAKLSQVEIKAKTSGTDGLSALAGLTSGRAGSGNIVNTSGTRGLDADQIKTSKPDFNALKTLTAKQVSNEAASQFAATAGLQSRNIAYLSAPITSTNSSSADQPVGRQ